MAASKKTIVDTFSEVSGLGPAYAEQCYDELGLRSLAELVEAAESGKLKELKGIGPAKEKSILESAKELLAKEPAEKKSDEPEKKSSGKVKPAPKKTPAKKAAPKKAAKKADAPKKAAKKAEAPKKAAKKAETPRRTAKKAEALKEVEKKAGMKKPETPKREKKAEKKEEPKKSETPKRPPRSRASDFESRAKESKSSRERPTIPGLLFKIGKKLVSRLLS